MGVLCRSALRTMPAYNKVIGTAPGNIIPTIMTAHIKYTNTKSTGIHGCNCMMAPGASAFIMGIFAQRYRTYAQAKTITPIRAERIVIRSRLGNEGNESAGKGLMEMDYKNPSNNQQLTGMLKNQEAATLAG